MSLTWLLFASLAVAGSVFYNISVKVGGDHVNPFVFTLILTAVAAAGHVICILLYKTLGENVSFHADRTGVAMAVIAGLGVVAIDLAFFFGVRSGGLMATTGFWVVGSLVITTLVSAFLFKEVISYEKMAGMVLGIVSLILLTRAP